MSEYSINLKNRNLYVIGINDVIQCWSIILSTVPGSIPLRPTFGSNLYQYIDKPVTSSFSQIANTIIKDLEMWEPRTKINKVTRTVEGSNILIKIYGTYTPLKQVIISTIQVVENPSGGIGQMIIGSTFIIK